MTFIAITFSIMVVSIFLIYKITHYFHCELRYKPLILCGLMAFAINFVTLTLSPYLNREHYVSIALLVVFAAAIVTFYNERLLSVEREAAGEEKANEEEKEAMGLSFFKGLTKSWKKFRDYLSDGLSGRGKKSTVIPAPAAFAERKVEEEEPAPKEVVKKKVEPVLEEAVPDKIIQEEVEPASAKPDREEIIPRIPLLEAPETKPLLLAPAKEKEEIPASEPPRPVNITEALAHLSSLDDILDYAQGCAKEGDYANAIFAYKRALERYQSDDYAPFIVIELVGVYKENGSYEEAVRTINEAMRLAGIAKNDAVKQEFQKNLVYLRTVQYVLSKHNAPRMPFGAIPPTYFDEIENVFASQQLVESAS